MRFQLIAARTAFAALLVAVLAGLGAVACVRAGLLTDEGGRTLMIPATALGLIALVLALLWLRSALARNQGDGKRIGLIALVGAIAFLYAPLSYVYYGYRARPIHDVTTDPENPPLARVRSRSARSIWPAVTIWI